MKLKGNMFRFPKEINEVQIVNEVMQVHNHDDVGEGYIYAIKATECEDAKFTLKKRDFIQLSKFEEFNIDIKNDVINIKSGKVKLKLANMVEFKTYTPDFTNMREIKVDYSELFKARIFTGVSDTKPAVQGVNVHNGCIVASDTYMLYEKKLFTEIGEEPINIPRNVFKSIPNIDSIKMQTNNKIIKFIFNRTIYYSNLLTHKIAPGTAQKAIDENVCVAATLKKDELEKNLKLIKEFDEYVDFVFKGKKMIATGFNEIEKIEIDLDCSETEITEEVTNTYNISKILTAISTLDVDKVKFKVKKSGYFMLDQEVLTIVLPYIRTKKGDK